MRTFINPFGFIPESCMCTQPLPGYMQRLRAFFLQGFSMRIYISGQITGTKDFTHRFSAAEKHLLEQGYDPVNPVEFGKHLEAEYAKAEQELKIRKNKQLINHGNYK